MDPELIVLALASLATCMTVVGIGMPYLQRDPLSSRLKSVTRRREELSAQQRARLQKRPMIREVHVGMMKKLLERLKLQNLIASNDVRIKLMQAGWRGQAPTVIFGFTRLVVGPIAFAIGAALIVFGVDIEFLQSHANLKFVIVLAALGIGFYFPNVILQNLIQKRQIVLTRAFPDALDLLVICVEAGLGLEAAFTRVAEEMAERSPVVAEEFGLTTAELAFLGDRRQALENLAIRTGLPSVKSLATSLIQAEKYGTPVAVSLRVIAQENRDSRMSRAEEKAASLPAKLTVPMIVFFLPVIFIVILGPAAIQSIRTF